MKAITTKSIHTDSPIIDMNKPKVNSNDVLIKVHSTGVNHVDLAWFNNPKLQNENKIFGLEIAGEVVDPNGHQVKTGQRVAALTNDGGYAEYAAIPSDRLILLPENFSYEKGASIPESFMTAYHALFWLGHLKENQTVLIHAGASSVGNAAVQLAKTIKNVTVITTSSSQKTQLCLDNGADYAIDYSKDNFADKVESITDNSGVNLILDFIGADYFHCNIRSLSDSGKLLLMGALSGTKIPSMDLMTIMAKNITISGTVLSSRSNEYKAALTTELSNYLQNTGQRSITPMTSKVFNFSDALSAQEYLSSKKNIGKIIINII